MKPIYWKLGTSAALLCAAMSAQAQEIQEHVVVTGSPLARGSVSAQSIAQVGHEDLMKSGGFGLGDALKNVPGVASSGFSAGATRPVIRGFDATRVRVTENGLGAGDVSDISGDHAVPIDPLSAVEVEVLRGAGTLRYGSQAIGGVVNAINNRIPFAAPAEGLTSESFASLSTNGSERMFGAIADMEAGDFAFHADGILRAADDYDTPQGMQANTYTRGQGFSLGGAYVGDGANLGASYSIYRAHYGISPEPGGEVSHIEMDQDKYSSALNWQAPFDGLSLFTAEGNYIDYHHEEAVDGAGILATFKNKEWEGRAEATHDGFGPIAQGALGMQAGRRDFQALGEALDYLEPTLTNSFAVYIFEQAKLFDALTLEASARAERINVKGSTIAAGALERNFSPASYALGLFYAPAEGWSLSANFSDTGRAPSVSELFAQGPHEASATFDIGDPALNAERARSLEARVEYEGEDNLNLSLSAFRSAFDGYIFGGFTGNSYDEDGNFFPDDSGEFAEQTFGQADATFWGFEAKAHLPLLPMANGMAGIDLSADYVRAKLNAGGNLPRITPLRYGGGVFFERQGLNMQINLAHSARQDDVAANETPTGGYTMLDASLTARLYDGPESALDLSLIGSNLTDVAARNHVSFTKDHVLLPSRNIRLVLRFVN